MLNRHVSIRAPSECPHSSSLIVNIHTSRTAGDLPSLLQALDLPAPIGLGLALHKVIVVRLAPVSDEVRRAHQRGGRRANLIDLGDMVGHRRRVDQDMLVEPVEGWDH